MIKPESLWGLFKTCEDSKWLGDICRALGRQEVELDFGQRQMVRTIEQDSGWMDERHAARLEKDRLRKQKSRGIQGVTRNPRDNAESVESAPYLPPYLPTDLPTDQPTEEREVRVRESDGRPVNVPTDEEARRFAKAINVPIVYLPKFFAEMQNHGWGYVNRGGSFVALNRRNFSTILRSFYDQAQKNAAKSDTTLRQDQALPEFKEV